MATNADGHRRVYAHCVMDLPCSIRANASSSASVLISMGSCSVEYTSLHLRRHGAAADAWWRVGQPLRWQTGGSAEVAGVRCASGCWLRVCVGSPQSNASESNASTSCSTPFGLLWTPDAPAMPKSGDGAGTVLEVARLQVRVEPPLVPPLEHAAEQWRLSLAAALGPSFGVARLWEARFLVAEISTTGALLVMDVLPVDTYNHHEVSITGPRTRAVLDAIASLASPGPAPREHHIVPPVLQQAVGIGALGGAWSGGAWPEELRGAETAGDLARFWSEEYGGWTDAALSPRVGDGGLAAGLLSGLPGALLAACGLVLASAAVLHHLVAAAAGVPSRRLPRRAGSFQRVQTMQPVPAAEVGGEETDWLAKLTRHLAVPV